MKANNYKLKENLTKEDLIKSGFKAGHWSSKYDNIECVSENIILVGEIELEIVIETNPMKFDDFDNMIVMDNSFCQPYTPFYGDNYKKEISVMIEDALIKRGKYE